MGVYCSTVEEKIIGEKEVVKDYLLEKYMSISIDLYVYIVENYQL